MQWPPTRRWMHGILAKKSWVGRLRSGREFSPFASPEALHTGRSFAAAIRAASELDDAGVDSPPNSPSRSPPSPLTPLSPSSPLSSLSSLSSTHSTSPVCDPLDLGPPSEALELPPLTFDSDGTSGWITEPEDVPSSSALQPSCSSPRRAGGKRKRKIYPSDVAAKKDRRRKKRQRENDALGPTAMRAPSYRGSPEAFETDLASEAHFPVNATGYSAERVDSILPGHLWTLRELEEIDFDVFPWDGRTPITILDDERRVVAVLVGRPPAKSGDVDGWEEVVVGLEAAINKLEADSTFSEKQSVHRRGPHRAKAFGVSHGGGQKCPSVLDQGSPRNQRAVEAFRSNNVFPATTVNFGPGAACYDHLDYGNAAGGWCSITSAGSYDPKRGGHLVLFDINKVVEFPPGSTILIPSSVMRHGNTPIQEGETRVGMTQYAAGALFRYADHGFKLKDDAAREVRDRVQAGAKTRFQGLLGLYSRFDALEQDRKHVFASLMAPRRKRNNDGDELWNHDELPVTASTIELSRDGKRVRWDTSQVQPAAPSPASGSGDTLSEVPQYFPEDSSLPFDDNVPQQDVSEDSPDGPTVVNVVDEEHARKRYVNSRWGGTFFQKTSLKALGLRIQLGHPSGQSCPYRVTSQDSFTVLHTNGIHQLAVDFCGCFPTVEYRVQCMRQSWWPASTEKPRSAATFTALKQFQTLSLQGKLAVYDYYKSLELITDGSSLQSMPVSFPALPDYLQFAHISKFRLAQLSLMVREYRHIVMLARGGRGHDPAGIMATKPGEIAVHCRICPQPGINLPEGWEKDVENGWLYALIIGMDACFRLQNRSRSSDAKDPTLGPGWATFIDDAPYHEHLKNYIHKDEISSCAGFAAIFLANLKRTTAVRTTGVGGVICSRHDLWRPNGLGDLQKGESLRLIHILLIFLSYDIMCQWIVNLWARVLSLPDAIRPTFPKKALIGKIPQFHLEAHGRKCHSRYSLRLTPGVGRVEGEAPERGWSVLGRAAAQTKEMGPGGRHNVIDDICGFANWRKTVGFGDALLKKLVLAITEAIYYWRALKGLEEGLDAEHPGCIAEWEKMLAEWERDPSKPCPYDSKEPDLTVNKVRLQLANEEHARLGLSAGQPHTPMTFVMLGLELEELQRSLLRDVKAKSQATSLQKAGFQDRRVTIRKKIVYFRSLQIHYMPGLGSVLEEPALLQDDPDFSAESTRLFMPSELNEQNRARACLPGVVDVECRIREAGLSDHLEQLRRHLRTRSHVNRWKLQNVKGQRKNTRARALQHRVDIKVHAAKMRYRHGRRAYLALAGAGPWTRRYRELLDEDCRALDERELTQKEKEERREKIRAGQRESGDTRDGIAVTGVIGDTRRTPSWIWYNASADGDDGPAALEALRIAWAKSKASARSWYDDVHLLVEEMRRAEVTTRHIANRWTRQARLRVEATPELQEGLAGYAFRHAEMEERLADKWAEQWKVAKDRAAPILAGNMEEAENAEKKKRTDQVIQIQVEEEDLPPIDDEY
ncbi:hypothetical protein HWV62_19137 [Athelia sp. TMB]|nr:hypothetical protein HWV62_19137 [Athelia sp. TMB]